MKDDLKALTGERDHLKKELLNYEADWLFTRGKKHTDIHLIKEIFNHHHQREMKLLAKKIIEKYSDTVILFGTKSEGNAQLLFQCSEKLDCDRGRLMKSACAVINGRGGGRPQQAQGCGPDTTKLEDALQSAEDMLVDIISPL